ncbi:MAG: DUF721 domain-containing protein [Gammaproteobacteria bacterium]|nr:DUF721 domain-containing protein [Gammaproteobacteria bacterium]MCP5459283.1 DUF721 domain-containing protein [Gammaproteobacteria bacterium]
MSEDKAKADARRLARQHTSQLLAILQGKVDKAEVANYSEKSPLPAARQPKTVQEPPAPVPERSPTHGAGPKTKNRPSPLIAVDATLKRKRNKPLNDLVNKTLHLAQLNRVFRSMLPTHLQEHATLARLDEEGWVVQTDSSAWATRLRYALPELRKPLQLHLGIELPRPRIRIAPPAVPEAPPPPSRRMTVTDQTVSVLENAAQNVADPRLGAAILRLAEHARGTRGNHG